MTFLQTHNLPATACFVSRYLSSRPDGVTEAELTELFSPPSLEGPAGKEKDRAGGFATEHTIRALKSIGLIAVDESRLFLAAARRPANESATSDRKILPDRETDTARLSGIHFMLGVGQERLGYFGGQRFPESRVLVSRSGSSRTTLCFRPQRGGCRRGATSTATVPGGAAETPKTDIVGRFQ